MRFIVAKLGIVSEKKQKTQVVFVPENQEAPVWVTTWLPTSFVQAQVVPGVEIVADNIGLGKLETEWEKDGVKTPLKTPRRSAFFTGEVKAIAPENEPVEEAVYVTDDATSAYVQAYRAKQASKLQENDSF